MHLQICWNADLGKRFFQASIVVGIALPAVFLTAALAASGVSYRAGTTCFPNQENSVVSLWAWLIGLTGLATVFQFGTSGYCFWVFLRSINDGGKVATPSSVPASVSLATPRSVGKKHAWRKIRRLFALQWRGLVISLIVTVESIYFATVFIAQDAKIGPGGSGRSPAALRWSTCIVLNRGDKKKCLDYADDLTLGKSTVLASLILASVSNCALSCSSWVSSS